jgi:hypothetical protein
MTCLAAHIGLAVDPAPMSAVGARPIINLDGGGHSGRQHDTWWHHIDMHAHRYALREAHPREDRVDGRDALIVGLRVRDVDRAGNAVDVTAHDLCVAHQLDLGRIADANGSEVPRRPPQTSFGERGWPAVRTSARRDAEPRASRC